MAPPVFIELGLQCITLNYIVCYNASTEQNDILVFTFMNKPGVFHVSETSFIYRLGPAKYEDKLTTPLDQLIKQSRFL